LERIVRVDHHSLPWLSFSTNESNRANRFFGLFGIYYSLQYLSLSDATVLTFLAPLCTAVAGALILKETFKLGEAVAGRASISCRFTLV
jgi:hypothetical protein